MEKLLPGGAWPVGALIEVVSRGGTEGLHLFLPVMRHMARQGRRIAWVGPPHPPHGPALVAEGLPLENLFVIRLAGERQELRALEQLLRSTECGLAFSWPGTWTATISRRLRLAAAEGGGLGVVFLREQESLPFSFATLRLALRPAENGLGVRILKAAAGQGRETILDMG